MSGHVTSTQPSENTFVGLFAQAGVDGNASVIYRSGTINVQGKASNGIFAGTDNGSPTVTSLSGTTIIVSGTNPGESTPTQTVTAGISAELSSGTAALGKAITVNAASTINTVGVVIPNASIFGNPVGIRALSKATADAAPVFVNYTGPGITTAGGGGIGILALARSGGGPGINSGGVTVASSGPITTSGAEALGIVADSGTIYNATRNPPVSAGPGGNIMVTSGAISTQGAEAHGIWAASTNGTVQVDAFNNVTTTGQFSTGINAISTGVPATGAPGNNVAVNVAQGVSVMGGWQDTGAGSSKLFALPAAGVILGSAGGTATLTNDGTIGALSDRAVANPPPTLFPSNNTSIINNGDGRITGFVQLVGGNNSILNNGTFNLRHFADTNGDGVPDTLRVAVTDLGPGTFTNNGTLALLGGPGAGTLDATGQYLPLGLTFNAMALGGPVQGQILGATTFTNAGTINLQANPVPGDVLLISGGHTPGSNGGGTFISSGGRLLIDTVLNAGGAASQSDVLVLDNAVVGAGGATGISVRNAGGPGALTVGNGILVVQALGTTAPGTFSLAGPVEAGAFSYLLFRGSVDSSGPQNWYLRSTLDCSLVPDAPECPRPPIITPPKPELPLIPDLRPAVPLYTALSPLATLYGFNVLGTLHERMGDPYAMVDPSGGGRAAYAADLKAVPALAPASSPPAVWGRLLGEFGKRDTNNFLSAGPDFTWGLGGLQSGFDVWRSERRDGARDHAGLYTAVGTMTADVQRVFRELGPTAGSINMGAVSVGGYWTHYGPGDWYVDAVTQGTWYDADARSVTGPGLHTHGLGLAGSLEGGYPFALTGRLWLEPQAQLIYQRVRFNDGSDQDALVSFSNSDALQGRLGARLVKTWDIGALNPRPLATWLRGNLWHEFLDGGSTTLAGLTGADAFTFAAPLKGTWAEIGGGATGAIGPGTTLFATTAYLQSVDGNHQYAWSGRIGATYRW
jgi:autotransporter family porin